VDSPPSDLINRPKDLPERSLKAVVLWALTLFSAAIFIAAAVPKLGGYGFFSQRFEAWGYPGWLEMGVGIAEVVSSVFLILPATAFYAAIVLGLIMVGAIYTHLALGTAVLALFPLVLLGALTYIAWMRRPQRLRASQPRVTTSLPRTHS
jgi:uncharacterized membrane protein YphA (DoxX/SURF4 family)